MTIRPATATDVPAICEVFHAARAEAMPWLPVLHTPEEDAAFFADLLDRHDAFVSGDDGFIVVSAGHVEQLYVHPRAWGRGIGSELLEHAKALHPEGLELWVFQRNERAIRFYEHHGFTIVRRTDGAHNEEREPDALLVSHVRT